MNLRGARDPSRRRFASHHSDRLLLRLLKSPTAVADMNLDACGSLRPLRHRRSRHAPRHLRGGCAPGRAEGPARLRAPAERGADAHLLADAGVRLEPRPRRRPATSSSSRRVDRSTEAPSSGRTSRAGAGSGKSCRAVTITAPASDDAEVRPRGRGDRVIKTTHRANPHSGDIGQPRPARGSRASRTRSTPTSARSRRVARPRGASRSGSTCAGSRRRYRMPAKPGLVRWAPVEGATAYDVWYPDIRKVIRTHTNVADQRELYSFHLEDSWWQLVRWRVRPVRQVVGALPNGLPAVSYGPWSPTYATTNPVWAAGKLQLRAAVSDAVSTDPKAAAHQLMPAMTFGGDTGTDGRQYRLFRAYAFTDRDCVNAVFRGSVVGGPAFAPRDLRASQAADEPGGARRRTRRHPPEREVREREDVHGRRNSGHRERDVGPERLVRVDLPDVDTSTTRYFWTVVPVGINVDEDGTFTYYDAESPQDACESGRDGELRQGVAAGDHRRRNAVRVRASRRRVACSRRPAGDRSSTRRRSSRGDRSSARRLRGAVVALEVPVAHARLSPDVRDVVGAPARLRRSGTTASAD